MSLRFSLRLAFAACLLVLARHYSHNGPSTSKNGSMVRKKQSPSTTQVETTKDTHHERQHQHGFVAANRHDEWDAWFQPVHDWDPAHSNNGTSHNNILYYHVMKTGGTTLFHLFDEINKKNGMPTNPGAGVEQRGNFNFKQFKNKPPHGIEKPGHLEQFIEWRNNPSAQKETRLLTASFREPVERVISHYFQLKPCEDGSGGGFDPDCRLLAQHGFFQYLDRCRFASNFESKYVDGTLKKVEEFDFLILNDRTEESLVLASIRFGIPVRDMMLYLANRNARVGTGDLQSQNKTKSLSCTAQWLKKLIPSDELQQIESCTHSCAGKIGRLIFTKEELRKIEATNEQDVKLWKNHVVPKYNADKARVLDQYGVTQEDLDAVVEGYRKAVEQSKVPSCKPDVRGRRQSPKCDYRRKLYRVAEWLQ